MSSTESSLTFSKLFALGTLLSGALGGCTSLRSDPEFSRVLHDGRHWTFEHERPDARWSLRHGVIDIDSPAGATLWLMHEMRGPVHIEFDATAVSTGGVNDQVSDLNVFWMATNTDGSAPYSQPRSGKFADYDDLLTYYVGLGGNRNTTSRFRRYVGQPGNRPLLPQHDVSDRSALLVPNRRQRIELIADGRHIEYRRDGHTLFAYDDDSPYVRGWFALRTTWSHLRIENFRVRRPRG